MAFLTSGTVIAKDGGAAANDSGSFDSGATGSGRLLMVVVSYENGDDPGVSAITYNSVSMTKEVEETVSAGDNFSETIEVWVLADPATGSNTLQLTNSSTSQDFSVSAAVYTGRDQTTPILSANNVTIARELSNDGTMTITKPTTDDEIFWALTQDRGEDGRTWSLETDCTIRETINLGSQNNGFENIIGDRPSGSGSLSVGATQTLALVDGPMDMVGIAVVMQAPTAGDIERTLKDGIDTVDAANVGRDASRALADAAVVEDDSAKGVVAFRLLDDGVDTLDATIRAANAFRLLTAEVEVADAQTRAADAARRLLEVLEVDDSLTRTAQLTRSLLDSVDTLDNIDIKIVILKILTDILEVSDSSFRTAYAIRALIDSVVTTDNLERSVVAIRELRDAIEVNDAVSVARSLSRLMLDDVTLADVLSSQFLITLGDSVSVQDALETVSTVNRQLIDALILLDSINVDIEGLTGIERTLVESIDVEDAIDISRIAFRALIDSVEVLDNAKLSDAILRVLTDAVVSEDEISTELLSEIFRQLVDGIVINDETVSESYLVRLMQDALNAEDKEELEYAVHRFLTDAVDASDNASVSTTLGGGVFFGLGIITTMVAEDIVTAIKRFD